MEQANVQKFGRPWAIVKSPGALLAAHQAHEVKAARHCRNTSEAHSVALFLLPRGVSPDKFVIATAVAACEKVQWGRGWQGSSAVPLGRRDAGRKLSDYSLRPCCACADINIEP